MKIKLDENMPADLASRLRQAGHDVVDVVEEGESVSSPVDSTPNIDHNRSSRYE